jgi:hypothetical protein
MAALAAVLLLAAMTGASARFADRIARGSDAVAVLFGSTTVRNGTQLQQPVASLLPPSLASSPTRIQQLLASDRDLGVSRNRTALVYSCSALLPRDASASAGNRTSGRRLLGSHHHHHHGHGHDHGHDHDHALLEGQRQHGRRVQQLVQANLQVCGMLLG